MLTWNCFLKVRLKCGTVINAEQEFTTHLQPFIGLQLYGDCYTVREVTFWPFDNVMDVHMDHHEWDCSQEQAMRELSEHNWNCEVRRS